MKPELAKVGPAWEGGNIERWPGVAGIAGETNHLEHNNPFYRIQLILVQPAI